MYIRKQRGFIGDVIGGALSFLGGERRNAAQRDLARETNMLDIQNARQARAWAHNQGEINRNFAKNMSNTEIRRRVADLKAAGINPVLSAKLGGASSPSASAPTPPSTPKATTPNVENTLGNAVSTALATRRSIAEVELMEAQVKKEESQAGLTTAQTGLTGKQEQHLDSVMDKINFEIRKLDMEIDKGEIEIHGKKLENIIKEFVTLPSGQLDVQKAEILMKQLRMEESIYDSKRGPVWKELEIINRGGPAAGIAAGAVAFLGKSAIGQIARALSIGLKTKNIGKFNESINKVTGEILKNKGKPLKETMKEVRKKVQKRRSMKR